MTDPAAPTPIPPEVAPTRRATDLPANSPWWALYIEANAKEAYKWASVQFPAVVAILIPFYAANQEAVHQWIQQNIPARYWPWIALGTCVFQIAIRIFKLKGKP